MADQSERNHPNLHAQGCEICCGANWTELYTARDRLGNSSEFFSVVRCDTCGVLRTLPAMSEIELAHFYPDDYWSEKDEPTDEWIRRSQSEKIRFLERCGYLSGRILDVGCGSGWFLRALDARRWDRFGVETGQGAVTAAGNALGERQVVRGTLRDAHFPTSSFDVITFWSSLEHTNDPKENLVAARRLLREGGLLIVQVPNANSYQARMFKGDWFSLDAPRHRYHFSIATLRSLLERTEFVADRITLFSRTHNSHALRQSLKTKLCKNSSPLGIFAFYLSIPLITPIDLTMTALGSGATITLAARASRFQVPIEPRSSGLS